MQKTRWVSFIMARQANRGNRYGATSLKAIKFKILHDFAKKKKSFQFNSLCQYQRYPNEGSWFKCDTDFLLKK